MINHPTGEYGPLVFLIEVLGISLNELAHESDELCFIKKVYDL